MLIRADARHIPLRDGCVQCVVTSPPYFGLRDYGTANQIGLEPTPDAYVQQLVAVFREVRRVLKDDGVLWLNLGDSYAASQSNNGGYSAKSTLAGFTSADTKGRRMNDGGERRKLEHGAKPKDLLGIPWRVAFALQADGWYLRSDVIWHKPNPMPESVTDRPTKAHEYLFLLSKSERYFYDANAIREEHKPESLARYEYGLKVARDPDAIKGSLHDRITSGVGNSDRMGDFINYAGRNKRTVWTVPTMPYSGAHFATMPEKLVEPCILAGSRLGDRVFDPFIGSGTVGAVAQRLGRRWVGLDLNPAYHELAKQRTAQRGLMFAV